MFATFRSFMLIFYMAGFVTLIGCSSTDKTCPPIEEEAVSMCRAEEKCRQEKTTYGVGLGVGKPTDSGIIGTRNVATTDNYNDCIQKDLNSQESQKQILDQSRSIE